MAEGRWIDLLDPTEAELEANAPRLHHDTVMQLLRPADPDGNLARPLLTSEGDYLFGVLLIAVALPAEDRVFYQEVDLVLTHDTVLMVRKTPRNDPPYDPAPVRATCDAKGVIHPGSIAYHLFDAIAESYLDLLDDIDEEIDELEEHIEEWPADRVRRRLSELRHDLLHIRRTLSPTRDAVRAVVDGRIDLQGLPLIGREVFPPEIERTFGFVYDKLLRATDSLELSRDLLASARDYHQSQVTNEQNEIVKRLTVIAALLLVPTFIVGVYGQNFHDIPELRWHLGYAFSWGLIVVVTILQLAWFRWKRWI